MSATWMVPLFVSIGVIVSPLSGSALAASETMSPTSPVAVAMPRTGSSFDSFIAEASRRFDIPIAWIRAVIRQESRGDGTAVSRAGAMGLMQIRPATWTELRDRYHLGSDAFDPRDNILAGTAYLSELLRQFGSPAFLAAYNMGPARYAAYVESGLTLPAETQNYLAKLAPVVTDDDVVASIEVASPAAAWWTGSPLFVALSSNVNAAPRWEAAGGQAIAPGAITGHPTAHIEPAIGSLFVTSPAGDLFP